MKHVLIIFAAFLIVSCATTKTAKVAEVTPAGDWDYKITGTPEGDFSGVMNVTNTNNVYASKFTANGGEMSFEKFTYDKATKKVGGEFYYSGTSILFDAVLNGDEMIGDMSAGGMSFPFKATRKK